MKQDKKGFVFIETIVVLVVLLVSLIGLYNLFSFVMMRGERREIYDNMNDVYKVNLIYNLFNTLPTGVTVITSDNCTTYMNSYCSSIFSDLLVDTVLITGNNINSLIDSDIDINNTMKEYLKTLKKDEETLVVSFNKGEVMHFSSLRVGEINE